MKNVDESGNLVMEYMKVGTQYSGTQWNVYRNQQGTGAKAWAAGQVFIVLGNVGDGRIELDAQTDGPRISIVKQGMLYLTQDEVLRLGNMTSWQARGLTDYGFGVGDATTYIYWTPSTGLVIAGNGSGLTQIDGGHITTNTITATQIAAGTITATQIASRTITADRIVAGAITANEIAASTITGAKIAANTITATQIAAGVITATEIASRTITADRIVSGAITANEIAASTITGAKIAAGTITATNIAASTITGAKIAANTITATQIDVSNLFAQSISLTGSLTAGYTKLDTNGINITITTASADVRAYTFKNTSGTSYGGLYAWASSAYGLELKAPKVGNAPSSILLDVEAEYYSGANIIFQARETGTDRARQLCSLHLLEHCLSPGP